MGGLLRGQVCFALKVAVARTQPALPRRNRAVIALEIYSLMTPIGKMGDAKSRRPGDRDKIFKYKFKNLTTCFTGFCKKLFSFESSQSNSN